MGDLALLDEPEFKLHAEVLDIVEMVDDVALRFAERARLKGITLNCDFGHGSASIFASVDIELLERALANLLENALKFTPSGGRITLAVCHSPASQADLATVQISVADTGAGITPADLPHLFDRFYQSRASVLPASSDEGKGLGLAIVKRIAELHQGSVSIRSEVGRGTCVVLNIPGR